ncbi:hypothetical protein OKA04_17180 [Luteolibacter flavescens]|uniref:Uncharacterized protein n=1 Tax=Luteolibacter flavescens TaxID=1859460 RepID=A0ABT3FTC5_9BACT|nr:hypothetical protein [Luteolibacter flavescens]MCW1886474.1 hypothetical protein [Luteolibacter flavescens]
MRVALLVLAFVAGSVGCRRSVTVTTSMTTSTANTLTPGLVINSAGSWSATHSKGSESLDISVSGTDITWTLTSTENLPGGASSSGSGSSGITLTSPSDPWFVYVDSPQELWFFNGTTELTYSLSSNGGSSSGPAIHAGKLLPIKEKVPAGLVPHLPANLQKLFPATEPEEPRPSL